MSSSKRVPAALIRRSAQPDKDALRRQLIGPRRGALTAKDASADPPSDIDRDDITKLRTELGLSQSVFAQVLNVSPETVKSWEQGKRTPDGAAVRLLQIVLQHPHLALTAIRYRGSNDDT